MKTVQLNFISRALAYRARFSRNKESIPRRGLLIKLFGLLFTLSLVACGGDDSSKGTPAADNAGLAPSQSYAIYTGRELQFELSTDTSGVEYKVTKQPSNGILTGKLVGNPLLLTYISSEKFVGDDQVLFTTTAADGSSTTGAIDITVLASPNEVLDKDANSASVAALESKSYATFSAVPVALGLSSNVKGVKFAITAPAANGTLTGSLKGNPLALSYTANMGFLGNESIAFSVEDSAGNIATGMLTVTVIENPLIIEDEEPSSADVAVAATGTYSTFSATPVHLGLSSNAAGMRFEIPAQPQNGVLTGSLSGDPLSLTYTSTAAFVGEEIIGFKVIDKEGVSALGTLTVTVLEDENNTQQAADITAAASAQSKTYSTFTNEGIDINLLANDERIKFSITAQPQNGVLTGSFSGNPLSLTYTPNAGFVGNEVVAFNVTDDKGASTNGSVLMTVVAKPAEAKDVVALAALISSSFATYISEPLAIELSTSVNDTMIQIVGQPANGTLTGALSGKTLSLSYVSAEQYVGSDTINFNVVDSEGNSAPGSVSIAVLAKPVIDVAAIAAATSGRYSTFSGVDIPLGLISSKDGVTFEITGTASNGVLTGSLKGNPVSVVYTPNDNFVGDETLTFTVTGNNSESAAGMMTITVMDIINSGIDSDGDGLSDLAEINTYGTSPVLADTDADGFSDFQEVVTYGFDSSVNNFRFNPLIADMPQLKVNITSAPDIYINYTKSNGSTTTESVTNATGNNNSSSVIDSNESSNSFEHAHSLGIEIGAEVEAKVGITGGTSVKMSMKVNQNNTWTTARGHSISTANENTTEITNLLESLKAAETSQEVSASNGGIYINVQVQNTGHLAYQLDNLYLNASYYDYKKSSDIVVPIGNLAFENSSGDEFPSFTLAPGEITTDLAFSSADLTVATVEGLLSDSQGLSIQPAIFDMLNEDGISYTFNRTGITAQDATVSIDFAGYDDSLYKMVATKAKDNVSGVSVATILRDILKLSVSTNENHGFITEINGIQNKNLSGYWVLLHAAGTGSGKYETKIYTSGLDEKRVLKLNPDLTNITSVYDLEAIKVKGGDLVKLYYLNDDDRDGLGNRAEYFHGTNPNSADTDGDGLTDKQEVDGWLVKYTDKYEASVEEHVHSSPLLADTDADGVSDYDEANVSGSNGNASLRRNPANNDTDGDSLFDAHDDRNNNTNKFLAAAYDNLDVIALKTKVNTSTGVVDVSIKISDVTEQGKGNPGNSIDSYEVHVYRHISTETTAHPEPLSAPVRYAEVNLGNTLKCGNNCGWHLVYKSEDIPGKATKTFKETGSGGVIHNRKLKSGESYKYIAFLKINGEYHRSSYSSLASMHSELIRIRILPGTLTNVLAKSDPKSIATDGTKVFYSANSDELWVKKGSHSGHVFIAGNKSADDLSEMDHGQIYKASTGGALDLGNNQPLLLGMDCTITYESKHRNIYPCWRDNGTDYKGVKVENGKYVLIGDPKSNPPIRKWYNARDNVQIMGTKEDVSPAITKGYVKDAQRISHRPPFRHELGKGDGAFHLGWEVFFDGVRIGRNSAKGNLVCGSMQTRAKGLKDGVIPSFLTDSSQSCASGNLFDVNISQLVPSIEGCYQLELLVREYDENLKNNNLVADPIPNKNRANVDRIKLCRNDDGIWRLSAIELKETYSEQVIYQVSTVKDGSTPISYRTRTMEWQDDKARTTMNGNLRLPIEIEVVTPE